MNFALKRLVRASLKEQPYPVFSFEGKIIPAASIWTASRVWVHTFRELGIQKGDRIVVNLPDSPAFLAVIIASIWEGITLIILPPDQLVDPSIPFFDAVAAITNESVSDHCIRSKDLLNPDFNEFSLRKAHYQAISDAAFILRSSGSVSSGRWNVLSYRGMFSVLQSHLPELGIKDQEIILSTLPWHHSFGLILDLLPALLSKTEIHRSAKLAKNVADLAAKIHELKSVRMNGVPLLFSRLIDHAPDILSHVHGGIMGGAAIPAKLADSLKGSNLRVGYGQTEASPGISLGEVGEFHAGCLGKPLGCEVKVDPNNQLRFKGENTFLGYWEENGLNPIQSEYIATGDLVSINEDGSMTFQGRIDDRIKLLNGREISPLELEDKILNLFVELDDVCVLPSESNKSLILLMLPKNDRLFTLNEDQLKVAIGSVAKWIKSIYRLGSEDWILTKKGDKNRKKLREQMRLKLSR